MFNHTLTSFLALRKLSPDSRSQADLTLVQDRQNLQQSFLSQCLLENVGIISFLSGDVFMSPLEFLSCVCSTHMTKKFPKAQISYPSITFSHLKFENTRSHSLGTYYVTRTIMSSNS